MQNETSQTNIMIYRDTKLDRIYAFKRISRRISRAFGRCMYKVLVEIIEGLDKLVQASK